VVQLSIRLTAAPNKAHELVQALHALMPRPSGSRGCMEAHIAADVERANTFWYAEDWPERAALEAHLRSDRFSQLLALLETAVDPPLVEFRVVTETLGLDYVVGVRNSTSFGTR
jgi:quinol monooxygenase YgiN